MALLKPINPLSDGISDEPSDCGAIPRLSFVAAAEFQLACPSRTQPDALVAVSNTHLLASGCEGSPRLASLARRDGNSNGLTATSGCCRSRDWMIQGPQWNRGCSPTAQINTMSASAMEATERQLHRNHALDREGSAAIVGRLETLRRLQEEVLDDPRAATESPMWPNGPGGQDDCVGPGGHQTAPAPHSCRRSAGNGRG